MYGTLSMSAVKPFHSSAGNRVGSSLPSRLRSNQVRCAVSAPPKPMTATGSLYEVLKVDPTATIKEIKTAYRSLAKTYHPDLLREGRSDGQDFIAIRNAYATLSDPSARAVYDLSLFANSRRRLAASFGYTGRRASTRRWETDQCW